MNHYNSWLYDEDVEPRLIGCTEWGAYASSGDNGDWMHTYGENFNDYYAGSPSNPIDDYDDFIEDYWLNDSEGLSPPADMHAPALLNWFADANLAFACYGPHVMVGEAGAPGLFDLSALRGNALKSVYVAEDGFSTHVRAAYEAEDASGAHIIDSEDFGNFHPTAQAELESCD